MNFERRPCQTVFQCSPCNKYFGQAGDLDQHKSTREHLCAYLKYWLNRNRTELQSDKHGITVSCSEVPECLPELNVKAEPGKTVEIHLRVSASECDRTTPPVELKECFLLHKMPYVTLEDEFQVTKSEGTVSMQPGGYYDIKVSFRAAEIGQYVVPVVFQFVRDGGKSLFYIARTLHLSCGDPSLWALEPEKQFDPKKRRHLWCTEPAACIIPGVPPSRTTSTRLTMEVVLGNYMVPDTFRDVLKASRNSDLIQRPMMTAEQQLELERIRNILNAGLKADNYSDYFGLLLHLEEVQNDADIRNYDLEDVTIDHVAGSKKLLSLEVPGLAENRPSVLRGDRVYARIRHQDTLDTVEYEGIVHEILDLKVHLGFANDLLTRFVKGTRFNVRFVVNRYPLRLMHRAVQLSRTTSMVSLLFPNGSAQLPALTASPQICLYNQCIGNNPEQLSAVNHIVAGTSRPAPYLLFGPPGTGKTVTMVEAMKQVWRMLPKSRILAAAPSNSAADLVTLQLLQHVKGERSIIRIYAASCNAQTIPSEIKKCCNLGADGRYFYPSKRELMTYRIVVATLVTAGRLVSAKLPPGHFTHVFVDEAGHALEPECIIPVAGLLEVDASSGSDSGGLLVLAGDPKQLGPVLRSSLAVEKGLGISLLERYMTLCKTYQRSDDDRSYDPRVLTKLLNNYRSHAKLLKIPNELFYDNELKVCAGSERDIFHNWQTLPTPGFPLLFHGVLGRDLQEETSPSYFNPEELLVVLKYVDDLLSAGGLGMKIQAKDIGIISPYRQQVRKIQQRLRNPSRRDISVGSTEEFQGQERQVIIISTVRSSLELLAVDTKHRLGFLKNPKRFNVAVTRAKSLLIVVGNPYLLSQDEHWDRLLQFCIQNGNYVGAPYSGQDAMDDLIVKLQKMSIENDTKEIVGTPQDIVAISQKTLQEEPQWRSEQ